MTADWSEASWRTYLWAYLRHVEMVDAALGRVLADVDLSSTYVFLLSDNGTAIRAIDPSGQDPAMVKHSTFEGGINIPMFVAGPGIPAGAKTQALVSSVDLMGTLSELILGVEAGKIPAGL